MTSPLHSEFRNLKRRTAAKAQEVNHLEAVSKNLKRRTARPFASPLALTNEQRESQKENGNAITWYSPLGSSLTKMNLKRRTAIDPGSAFEVHRGAESQKENGNPRLLLLHSQVG